MKTKPTIVQLVLLLLLSGFVGCKSVVVLAPPETVPKRNALPYDAFGGYITIQTLDKSNYAGELIGMRNDSVIVLTDSLFILNFKNISKARIIVYSPNRYEAGYFLAIPSIGLLAFAGEYGDNTPVALSLLLSAIDVIAVSMAIGTENYKVNYFDWSGGWEEVMKYSRFPYGIPQRINILELKGRISQPYKMSTKN